MIPLAPLISLIPLIPLALVVLGEVEHVKQVTDGRHVLRYVRMLGIHLRIGKVVATARCQLAQVPVALDELHHRRMVIIAVNDVAAARVGEITSMGMRGPSPKKSSGCMKPESQ